MDFVFVCPETQQVFNSDNFSITENAGVKNDSTGEKFLDAKVVLSDPCPYCGKRHAFHARELSCPFGFGETTEKEPTDGER